MTRIGLVFLSVGAAAGLGIASSVHGVSIKPAPLGSAKVPIAIGSDVKA